MKKAIEVYKANKQCFRANEGWDIIKENIKEIAQERSTEISKQKRNELEEIRKDIKNTKLNSKKDNKIDIDTNTDKLKELVTELDKKDKIEGERIRWK